MQDRAEAVEAAQRAYREAAAAVAEESFSYPAEDAWDSLENHELVEIVQRALAGIEVMPSRGRGRNADPVERRVPFVVQDPDVATG